MMDGKFYTYTHAYPESMGSAVFYVGKGTGYRINMHEVEARNGGVSIKCDIIRSIWAAGEQIVKTKVYDNISEDEAYQHELELIRFYGLETLANRVASASGAPQGNQNRRLPDGAKPKRGKATKFSMPYEEWQAFKIASNNAYGRIIDDEDEYTRIWRETTHAEVLKYIENAHKH